jgi:hypothetical protein
MADSARLETALAAYEREHEFARRVSLSVEDRLRWDLPRRPPATGAYRWFRSPNVIDLEAVRHLRRQGRL